MHERRRGPAILNLVAALLVLVQLPPSPVTMITSNGTNREIEVLTQPWLFGLTGILLSGILFLVAAVLLWRGTPLPAAVASTVAFMLSLYFAADLRVDLDVAAMKIRFNIVFVGLAASAWALATYWRARPARERALPAS